MKALLFQLIRSLEFELDARVEDIARKSVYVSRHYYPLVSFLVLPVLLTHSFYLSIVTRPYLISQKEKGNQLPMIIRPVSQ